MLNYTHCFQIKIIFKKLKIRNKVLLANARVTCLSGEVPEWRPHLLDDPGSGSPVDHPPVPTPTPAMALPALPVLPCGLGTGQRAPHGTGRHHKTETAPAPWWPVG